MCTRPTLGKWSAKLGPFAILLLTSAYPLSAATVTVCPSGCDSTTIQGAITGADAGDLVQILSSQAHTESDIYVTKDITVAGFGVLDTIVQADATSGTATLPVFVVVAGSRLTLESLTVRHGGGPTGGALDIEDGHAALTDVQLEWNQAAFFGGAVYVSAGSSLEVVDSWIMDNTAQLGGGVYNLGSVVITGTMVRNNAATNPSGVAAGGGVYNLGDLTVVSSTVSQNDVIGAPLDDTMGGGIYHGGSILMVEDSWVKTNTVDGGAADLGGGVFIDGDGSVTLLRASLYYNEAESGGAVYFDGGNLTVEDCTIKMNTATISGGGLFLDHFGLASATIAHSTVVGNQALVAGGFEVIGDGVTRIYNSTISGNAATDDAGGLRLSGSNTVAIASTTITDNVADSDGDSNGSGGGIVIASGGDVEMRNTILAGNLDGSTLPAPRLPDCVGTIQSAGFNLIGSLGVIFTACTIEGDTTGNLLEINPLLLTITDNGGPTETHALDSGSPAIDAGDPAGCVDPLGGPLLTDQRHGIRQDRCDMGAYEASGTFGLIFADDFESGGLTAWSGGTG